jgi:parallel beta-helix repeat protein
MAYTPIEYTRRGNEIIIPDIEGEKKVSLAKLFAEAPDGAVIRFGKGRFSTEAGYEIDRSLTLIGDPDGYTTIGGKNKQFILHVSTGNVTFDHIEVENFGALPIHKVVVTGGKFTARNCSFTDGMRMEGQTDGHGLKILGDAEFEVYDSRFFDHPGCGCYIHGNAKGIFSRNQLANADTCLSIGENAVVHVDSCQISSAKAGIGLADESVSTVENCDISDVRGGFLVFSPKNNVIRNNDISGEVSGVNVWQDGHALIVDNRISNHQAGIFCKENGSADIRNNDIFENMVGILCKENSHNIQIEGNKIHHNSRTGIVFEDSSEFKVFDNSISKNENDGIAASMESDGTILENKISNNQGYGIRIEGHANVRASGNHLESNSKENLLNTSVGEVIIDQNFITGFKVVNLSPAWDGSKWVVQPPEENARIDPDHLADSFVEGQTLYFGRGKYQLGKTWNLEKPLRLTCDDTNAATIVGRDEIILEYSGSGELIIENIIFETSATLTTTGIKATSGALTLTNVEVFGAKDSEHTKHSDGAGVVCSGKTALRMDGCRLHDNELGASILENATAEVRNCVITDNIYGIICRDRSQSEIEANEFSGQLAFGVMGYDHSNIRVIGNSCHDNKGAGVGVINSTTAWIEGNTCVENGMHGIFADHDGDITIRRNECHSNQNCGISVCGTLEAVIEENVCHSNSGNGIEAFEQAQPTIRNNKTYNNSNGVRVADGSRTVVTGNECYDNHQAGIELLDSAVSDVRENHVHHNGGEGIDDRSFEDETIIEGNTVEFNGVQETEDEDTEEGESIDLGSLSDGFSFTTEDDEDDIVDPNIIMQYIANQLRNQASSGSGSIAIPLGGINMDAFLKGIGPNDDNEDDSEEEEEDEDEE